MSLADAKAAVRTAVGRRLEQIKWWESQNGRRSGDPAKLAKALITAASQEPPPGWGATAAARKLRRGQWHGL
jgi:hypothetical protein